MKTLPAQHNTLLHVSPHVGTFLVQGRVCPGETIHVTMLCSSDEGGCAHLSCHKGRTLCRP